MILLLDKPGISNYMSGLSQRTSSSYFLHLRLITHLHLCLPPAVTPSWSHATFLHLLCCQYTTNTLCCHKRSASEYGSGRSFSVPLFPPLWCRLGTGQCGLKEAGCWYSDSNTSTALPRPGAWINTIHEAEITSKLAVATVPFPGPETQQSHCRNPGNPTPGQRIYIEANSPSIINRPVLSFLCRNHGTQQTETRPAAWDLQPLKSWPGCPHSADTGSKWTCLALEKDLPKIGLADAYGLFDGRN